MVGSALPALLFGVAFGNLVSGMAIEPLAGTPTATGFAVDAGALNYTGNLFGLLNPFSLLLGVMTLTIFMAHGAIYLALKTSRQIARGGQEDRPADRARRGCRRGRGASCRRRRSPGGWRSRCRWSCSPQSHGLPRCS